MVTFWVIVDLNVKYSDLEESKFTTTVWHHPWLLYTENGTSFFHFLHLHVEILFTTIIHLHIHIQTVVFHSIAFYETGYLHPYFIAKGLPLLLGILKYEQWLLTQQEKNLNNLKHPETTHQIQTTRSMAGRLQLLSKLNPLAMTALPLIL